MEYQIQNTSTIEQDLTKENLFQEYIYCIFLYKMDQDFLDMQGDIYVLLAFTGHLYTISRSA